MSGATPFNGETRQADGLLVQAVSPEGRFRWLRRRGMGLREWLREALREIAAECDARNLKVEVISTPTTIWRDLQGTRGQRGPFDTGTQAMPPEANLLGAIGRLDLLARG